MKSSIIDKHLSVLSQHSTYPYELKMNYYDRVSSAPEIKVDIHHQMINSLMINFTFNIMNPYNLLNQTFRSYFVIIGFDCIRFDFS